MRIVPVLILSAIGLSPNISPALRTTTLLQRLASRGRICYRGCREYWIRLEHSQGQQEQNNGCPVEPEKLLMRKCNGQVGVVKHGNRSKGARPLVLTCSTCLSTDHLGTQTIQY